MTTMRNSRHRIRKAILIIVAFVIIATIVGIIGNNVPDGNLGGPTVPPYATALPKPSTPAAEKVVSKSSQPTVEYVVTGSKAYVSYGPTGFTFAGTSPMHVARALATPGYYLLWAQLLHGGTVTVKILVNGKVTAQQTANGGMSVAEVEIDKNPYTGKWQDGNKPNF
jgi:hypothetical protein